MRTRWRIAKNGIANLSRGSASALVAFLLPPVLIRNMPTASYAIWVLVLQTAAYVGYLDFGLQVAIGRYIAYANERKIPQLRDSIFSTAFAGLCLAAVLSSLILFLAVIGTPRLFPEIPLS